MKTRAVVTIVVENDVNMAASDIIKLINEKGFYSAVETLRLVEAKIIAGTDTEVWDLMEKRG